MKKARKVLSFVLALMMLVSCVSVGTIQAATTISYAPNPKVEYGYSSGVTTGTIRYISQIRGSTYFNSNYWGSWASQAGIECGTASISMALSYVGVNKTPKAILDAHSGTTYFTGWGPTTSNPSVANGMNNYINGNGKYSPPIVHFTTGYASGSHYVILIGKVSSSSYLVLDPASNSTWTLSTSDAKYKSINQVFQYYNPNASINNDTQKPVISNVKIVDNNSTGYTVTCTVTDNVGVTRVAFPSWTHFNGQDDLFWRDGTKSGNTYSFRVNKSEHNGESEWYSTHIYAYDAAGNTATFGTDVLVPPDGKVAETTYNGNRYVVYKGKVSYQYAKDLCESYGGHLARITSAGENDVVKGLVAKVGTCRIDGSDAQNEGTWKFSNGEKMTYLNWMAGEPNNDGNQDYLVMYPSGKWDDGYEIISAYIDGFVCEFEHTHSYSSKVTKQPTCTSTGVKTFTCSCGASYTETIAKTSHNSNTKIPAVAPTCKETGLTEGKKCSVCGTVTVAQQIIDKVDCVNNDGDDMCDYCEKDMPINEPDISECSCSCHKGGIAGFFFKLINFFEKIFGINKVCACGVKH